MATPLPTIKNPLYGHASPETSYFVADYPYGFRLRCQIRYWIEEHPKLGFRFCSQTTNPKRGWAWNAPKKGTYCTIAECLYLDGEGKVKSYGVTEHSDVQQAGFFAWTFPDATAQIARLRWWAKKKAGFNRAYAAGKVGFTLNGVPVKESAEDLARHAAEAEIWDRVAALTKRDK